MSEAAIDALGKLTGHADDEIFVAALSANGAQVVRAAAIALKDSPRADVRRRGHRGVRSMGGSTDCLGAGRAGRAPRGGGPAGDR